jgi:hypothetical protein
MLAMQCTTCNKQSATCTEASKRSKYQQQTTTYGNPNLQQIAMGLLLE